LPPEAIAQMPPGATGELVFSVNPLIYCYNLPLFTALAIAVPGEEGRSGGSGLGACPGCLPRRSGVSASIP
jgi:hypothetical protein